MKLAPHNNSLTTNTEVESQEFGIGDASVVIEILRNRLYQHKVRTLVQEYMCNARDAHRECGNDAPIQVTVPNANLPVFKVRDFGPGISPSRMKDVFVMYGASTKRGTNKQTGGFGIGAKSAWSYTDSFNIVTHIDGVRRTYIAHTGVNNNGRLDLIATDATTEANGTEIQVAVKPENIDEFVESVFRACYFWTTPPTFKGIVDHSGFNRRVGTPMGKWAETVSTIPDFVSGRSYGRHMMVAVDGVPYNVTDDMLYKCASLRALWEMTHEHVILSVGNGVLETAATREQLADTPSTVKALEQLGSVALASARQHIKDEYAKVANVSQFLETHTRLAKQFRVGSHATHNGYTISHSTIQGPHFVNVTMQEIRDKSRRTSNFKVGKRDVSAYTVHHYGRTYYTVGESALMVGRRLRTLVSGQRESLLLSLKPGANAASFKQLIADLGAIDLATIAPATPQPRVAGVKRQLEEVCIHIPYDRGRSTGTVKVGSETHIYVYTVMNEGEWTVDRDQLNSLREHMNAFGTHRLVGIAKPNADKLKGNSKWVALADYLSTYVPRAEELRQAKRTVALNFDWMEVLCAAPGIRCKKVAAMQEEYKSLLKAPMYFPALLMDKLKANNKSLQEFIADDAALAESVKDKYKLLQVLDKYTRKKGDVSEWVHYINSKK